MRGREARAAPKQVGARRPPPTPPSSLPPALSPKLMPAKMSSRSSGRLMVASADIALLLAAWAEEVDSVRPWPWPVTVVAA